MELLSLQLIFLLCVVLLSLIGFLWPLVWVKVALHRQGLDDEDFQSVFGKPLSVGNCVACGAFFALCFLHLVPQSEEKWRGVFTAADSLQKNNSASTIQPLNTVQEQEEQTWEADEPKSQTTFPVGALLILLSFTLMLFLEQTCAKNNHADLTQSERIPIIILTKPSPEDQEDTWSQSSSSTVTSTIVGSEATSNETSRNSFDGQYVSFKDIDGQYLIKEDDLPKFYGSLQGQCSLQSLRQRTMSIASHREVNKKRSNSILLIPENKESEGKFKSFGGPKVVFFVFGIFIHNLLEGLTLGVQTNKSSAISLFTAIMLHGFPLATAVTAALLKHWIPLGLGMSRMAFYLVLMCFIRPLGIILGIFVVHVPGITALIIAATMQSLSAGIFIHITFMSLLPEEFNPRQDKEKCRWKVLAFSSGWIVMTLLSFVV